MQNSDSGHSCSVAKAFIYLWESTMFLKEKKKETTETSLQWMPEKEIIAGGWFDAGDSWWPFSANSRATTSEVVARINLSFNR